VIVSCFISLARRADRAPKRSKTWHVPASTLSVRTSNPIRQIVESIRKPTKEESGGKEMVPLSLGDPTIFKNMPISEVLMSAMHSNIDSHDCDGYTHSCGTPSARAAIAQRYALPNSPVTADDVIITSGCSGALDLALSAMINEGDNVLLPCPGFALYNTIVEARGGKCKDYNLVAERGWECDLAHMESQIDSRTRCILINNPSNPCGSVFSLAHLQDIVALAERHCLPIIADEIYGGIVFDGCEMHPLAAVSTNVPIITCGGLAKEFLVPGWRLGWIVVHDRAGILAPVKAGMQRLATLTLGANTLVQNCLPAVLTPEPGTKEAGALAAFHKATARILQTNAEFVCAQLAGNPCLEVIVPSGGAWRRGVNARLRGARNCGVPRRIRRLRPRADADACALRCPRSPPAVPFLPRSRDHHSLSLSPLSPSSDVRNDPRRD
jgi:tyrosine aminotransferase